MTELNSSYWDDRYETENIPWDIGSISPPLKRYIDQIKDKDTRILIPGAGFGHEGKYLWQQGFKNIYICDWSEKALQGFRNQIPDIPEDQLLNINFFDIDLTFDLILEQTFFCAIDPGLRHKYVNKTATLLHSKGRIAGLLFARHFEKQGPPFGGTAEEYRSLFEKHFVIDHLAPSKYSIKPRLGHELFFEFIKKE